MMYFMTSKIFITGAQFIPKSVFLPSAEFHSILLNILVVQQNKFGKKNISKIFDIVTLDQQTSRNKNSLKP